MKLSIYMFGRYVKIVGSLWYCKLNIHFKNHGLLISYSGLVHRLLNGLEKVFNFSMPHFNLLYSTDKSVAYFTGML